MISLANNRVSKTPTRWFQIWNLDTDHLCARTELALKTQLRRSSAAAGVSQRTKTDANFSQQNQLLTTYFLRSSYLHNKLIRKQVQKNFDSFTNSVWFSRKKNDEYYLYTRITPYRCYDCVLGWPGCHPPMFWLLAPRYPYSPVLPRVS